jgi:uncharacterized RDD family membrane protein YckC
MSETPPANGDDNQTAEPGPCTGDHAPGIPPSTGVPPVAPARRHHLLWLRAAAALVDIALLCGLFIVVGLATGGTPAPALPGTSTFTVGDVGAGTWWLRFGEVTVAGRWLALYLAILLLYFFILETRTGQTAGKRLLGLRVLGADANRPSAAAIATRTLLRLVDWLPLLYLTGFITILATGARRQRLGDLAAGTAVTAALPARRQHPALAVTLALLAVAGMSVRVTSGGSAHVASRRASQDCQAHGVSFQYPAGWRQETVRVRAGGTNLLCRTGLFIGSSDAIIIEAHPLTGPVTARYLGTIAPLLKRLGRRLFAQIGGVLQAGPRKISIGGLPGVEFRGTGHAFNGTRIHSTIVLAYHGRTEYAVNCQYTRQHAAQIQRGCDQILRTFQVSSAG